MLSQLEHQVDHITDLVERVYAGHYGLPLEGKHPVGLDEGLDLGQGLEHQQPLRPRGEPRVPDLVTEAGQHLVHLEQSRGQCLSNHIRPSPHLTVLDALPGGLAPDIFLCGQDVQGGKSEFEIRPKILTLELSVNK